MNGYNHSDVRTETLQGIPSSHLQNAANAPYIRLTSQSIEIGCSCGIDPGKPRCSLRYYSSTTGCNDWQAPPFGYRLVTASTDLDQLVCSQPGTLYIRSPRVRKQNIVSHIIVDRAVRARTADLGRRRPAACGPLALGAPVRILLCQFRKR